MKLYGTDQLLNICKASVLPRAEEVRAGERERPRGASWGGREGLGATVGFRGGDVETSVGCYSILGLQQREAKILAIQQKYLL